MTAASAAAIRSATADDLEDVLGLRLAFIADLRGVDPSTFEPAFVDATRAYLDDVAALGRIRSWLAEDTDGSAVAVLSVLRNDAPPLPEQLLAHEGYIVNLWVAPAARRQGLARALLQAAIDAAPGWGLRRLYLHATDDGRPLYEETGFVPDARWMGLRLAGSP
ncbi:MAG: acetyltransferase [Ilumatobacteraceae bacterium]|nr:acetyltransferase [Ilumatobacteraceae bacterium]